MATYEKRGYIKQYDEYGMLISKTQKGTEEVLEEALEEDLFGGE